MIKFIQWQCSSQSVLQGIILRGVWKRAQLFHGNVTRVFSSLTKILVPPSLCSEATQVPAEVKLLFLRQEDQLCLSRDSMFLYLRGFILLEQRETCESIVVRVCSRSTVKLNFYLNTLLP